MMNKTTAQIIPRLVMKRQPAPCPLASACTAHRPSRVARTSSTSASIQASLRIIAAWCGRTAVTQDNYIDLRSVRFYDGSNTLCPISTCTNTKNYAFTSLPGNWTGRMPGDRQRQSPGGDPAGHPERLDGQRLLHHFGEELGGRVDLQYTHPGGVPVGTSVASRCVPQSAGDSDPSEPLVAQRWPADYPPGRQSEPVQIDHHAVEWLALGTVLLQRIHHTQARSTSTARDCGQTNGSSTRIN